MVSSKYGAYYYMNSETGDVPVKRYIDGLAEKVAAKVAAYVALLVENGGYLDEPYSRHITGKIRELRVDFGRGRHRVFYFATSGKRIILLHAFLKATPKTPPGEISRALRNYADFIRHDR